MTTDAYETSRPFFVAGGTVPPGSPSYVERGADGELLEALRAGEFCYVLNSRQMGKSSLAVRTIGRLREEGVRTAFVDLTKIGSANLSAEQWYAGLLAEVGRALGLRSEAVRAWRESPELGYAQRLFGFLQERAAERPTVLMIDEIDATRSLGFSTDEFFAGVRQCWNARATDPAQANLTLCLLGAALPSDLIRDPRATPFNVGRRIDLRDFTAEEARPFAEVVGGAALARVLYWTGGHPFLTQSLCAELASPSSAASHEEGGALHPQPPPLASERRGPGVDALVRSRYLDARARETDTNLADVGNRLLGTGDPGVTDEDRATTLALYERMLKGKSVQDDESNPSAARIKMSGVARVEGGLLKPRNRIYAEAFGREWVRESMPGHELRRQRRAFWRGALRTGAIATVVVAAIGGLAWNNARLARIADVQRRAALKAYYAATMQGLAEKQSANDMTAIARTLEALKDSPSRGWEWDHWNVVAHPARRTIVAGGGQYRRPALLADGRTAIMTKGDGIEVFDLRSGRSCGRIELPRSERGYWSPVPLRSGEALLYDGLSTLAVVDVDRRKVVRKRTLPFRASVGALQTGPVGRTLPIIKGHGDGTWNTVLLDTDTLRTLPYPADRKGVSIDRVSFGPDGAQVALYEATLDPKGRWKTRISIRASDDWHEIRAFDLGAWYGGGFGWSPDGRWLSFSRENGEVYLVDLRAAAPRPRRVGKLPKTAYNALPSADGRTVLACGGREARELDARTGRIVRRYPETSYLWPLDGGRELLTAYWDFRIYRTGEVERGERTRALPRNIYPAGYTTHVDPSGKVIAFPTDDSGMWTLDLHRKDPPTRRDQRPGRDPRGLVSVLEGADEGALVDNATGRRLPFRINSVILGSVAVTRNRRTVVIGHDKQSFAVYDADSARPKVILAVDGLPCRAEFSNDDRRLALGDSRGGVTIVDTATWRILRHVPIGGNPQYTLGFSDDGRSLYGLDDQEVAVIDVPMCRLRTRLVGNSDIVFCTAFHPDGTRVATGAGDGTVRIWDAEDGRELSVLGRHPSGVVALGFIDGGRSLVSVDDAGGVRMWLTRKEGG